MAAAPVLLLVHDDPDVLDWLTTLLEASGYQVVIGATAFAARAKLERNEVVAILAGWDVGGGAGRSLFYWAKERRPELLGQFLVLSEAAEDFKEARDAGLTLIEPTAYEDVLEWVDFAAGRGVTGDPASFEAEATVRGRLPYLLLVEDDPHQVNFIKEILANYGFAVAVAEDADEAIAKLGAESFDVILSDWYMAGGGGDRLYQWLLETQPELVERCIFMTGGSTREIRARAPIATCFPKGQDSKLLVAALTRAARAAFDVDG